MGYYTKIITKEIRLRKDTPEDVIAFIDNQVNGDGKLDTPTHALFKEERWDYLFGGSYYLEQQPCFKQTKGYWCLLVACEINYQNNEIELFADWIAPYVTGHKPKEYIGCYEGEDSRNIGYKGNIYIQRTTLNTLKHTGKEKTT